MHRLPFPAQGAGNDYILRFSSEQHTLPDASFGGSAEPSSQRQAADSLRDQVRFHVMHVQLTKEKIERAGGAAVHEPPPLACLRDPVANLRTLQFLVPVMQADPAYQPALLLQINA